MLEFIGRRLLLLIPTIILISIISFILIQLPPGDFLTSYIMQLESGGQLVDQALIDSLKQQYGLDQPIYVQYYQMGIQYGAARRFWTILYLERTGQGPDLGTIGPDRCHFAGFTALYLGGGLSRRHLLGHQTILGRRLLFHLSQFPWIRDSAVPAGVGGDVDRVFQVWDQRGRFVLHSSIADAPWSWEKVGDLLQHLWIPMVVLGMGGTAGLIRIMRANLLDELHKPYVTTSRAKGMPETKLIVKHPVRVALNPFVSTVGWTLPGLVSGSVIVSVVLNLPTTGPILLRALQSQDMYLAGTIVMMLSILTVIGTLVSDILLAWLDPRIRLQ